MFSKAIYKKGADNLQKNIRVSHLFLPPKIMLTSYIQFVLAILFK